MREKKQSKNTLSYLRSYQIASRSVKIENYFVFTKIHEKYVIFLFGGSGTKPIAIMFVTQFKVDYKVVHKNIPYNLACFFLLPGQKNFQLIPDNLLYGARI